MNPSDSDWHALCNSRDLLDSGDACPFDVVYRGQTCRAFAVRFGGRVYAYLNRCSHVAMEMDLRPNRFFTRDGQFLVCSSHGALFDPASGRCLAGPGRGPLIQIEVLERDGAIHWRSQYDLKPFVF